MPAGRPTKYEGKITLAKVRQFLDECVDTIGADGKTIVNFPSNEALALFLDVRRETLYEWKNIYPEFSHMLEKVQQEQAKRLLSSGLGGQYNSNIAKLVLAKQGYHDVSEQNLKNDGGKFENVPMNPAILEATRKYEEDLRKAILGD